MTDEYMGDPEDFVSVETGTKGLKAIMEEAIANSIWETRPVEDEPEIFLVQWQIFESPVGRHFMGYNDEWREGRVSSPIITFDSSKMRGVTRSGRVYQLSAHGPGYNGDAQYVLESWLRQNGWTQDDIDPVTI